MVAKSKNPTPEKASAKIKRRTYVRQDDVRERIVDTALRLLLTRDPESLTIREIAAQAKLITVTFPIISEVKAHCLPKYFRVPAHP